MPAGVTWGRYLSFFTAAFLTMLAGAQTVHIIYRPMDDIDRYVEKELDNIIEKEVLHRNT